MAASPGDRSYAFGRLLYCVLCGEAMRSRTDHGTVYYRCRVDVTRRCPAPPLREDVAVAWATALFERLEALQPEALAGAVERTRKRRADRGGSVEQVEASLRRLEKLFVWGHLPEREYMERRQQLADLRGELSAPAESAGLGYESKGSAKRGGLPTSRAVVSCWGLCSRSSTSGRGRSRSTWRGASTGRR